jgi:ferredoxin-NAD(P)+ reductase (naphthalene dioxygenase ferredoxin-specific)
MPFIQIDGQPDKVAANAGETILCALIRNYVAVPYSCQAGNCGTCKCEYLDGDIMQLDCSEFALPPDMRAKNVILMCRTQVWGDVRVRLIDEEDLVAHPSRVMPCKVVALDDLTHDVKRLRLQIRSGGPFYFSAGQYAKLRILPGIEREYSMANVPFDVAGSDGMLEFHVRLTPGGAASAHIHSRMQIGDEMRVSGPYGSSYLREKHGGGMVLIAGGSGLAPVLSIAETALARGHTEAIRLYFGVRDEPDVYCEERLHRLAKSHSNFGFHIVLSAPLHPSVHRTGWVTDAVAQDFDDLLGMKAYLCGPPPMVEAAIALCEAKGLELRDIHADAFYTEAEKSERAIC